MADPFKKVNKAAGSKGSAKAQEKEKVLEATTVISEAPETLVPEIAESPTEVIPEVTEPEAPAVETTVDVVVKDTKVDVTTLSGEEAKKHVNKQFELKVPVFVVALQDGEHPKSGQWKRAGEKFQLMSPEAYSHRWMKLA